MLDMLGRAHILSQYCNTWLLKFNEKLYDEECNVLTHSLGDIILQLWNLTFSTKQHLAILGLLQIISQNLFYTTAHPVLLRFSLI